MGQCDAVPRDLRLAADGSGGTSRLRQPDKESGDAARTAQGGLAGQRNLAGPYSPPALRGYLSGTSRSLPIAR